MTECWTCPTCNIAQSDVYCSRCGDERLRPHDLTFRDVAVQAGQALTSLDGKLLRSFFTLLARPGALTRSHVAGQRRAWLGPAQIFFITNALFFAAETAVHAGIFSATLDSHLHHQDWAGLAQQMVDRRLAATHLSLESYAAIFNQAMAFNAKALVIMMVLAFTPIAALMFYGRHRPIGAHVVFALHTYAFVLLLYCLSLGGVALNVFFGGPGLLSAPLDIGLTLFNLGACGLYLYFAVHRVYGAAGWQRLAKTLALTVGVAAITVGYRFAIFLITVATT